MHTEACDTVLLQMLVPTPNMHQTANDGGGGVQSTSMGATHQNRYKSAPQKQQQWELLKEELAGAASTSWSDFIDAQYKTDVSRFYQSNITDALHRSRA